MTTVSATQGGFYGAIAGNINDTLSSTPAADASVLPDPVDALAISGDPGAELAALAVKSGEQQQAGTQAARDTEQKIEVSEDEQQVAAMQKKADDIRSSGLADGLGMVAEGGFTVAAAGVTASGGAGASAESAALKFDGTVLKAVSGIDSANSKAAEATDDANAAAAKSASDQAKSAADDAHDAKKSAGDFISAAIDFYREYTSAQASANSAALHRA
jgi:hypothetical protein